MPAKCLVVWETQPRLGRDRLSHALAAELARRHEHVLRICCADDNVSRAPRGLEDNPLGWMARFQGLSPVMLRNYLKTTHLSYATLNLKSMPTVSSLKILFNMLAPAYSWIIWTSPVSWTLEALTVLDQAIRLVWLAPDGPQGTMDFQRCLDQTATFHFPNTLSLKAVIPDEPPASPEFREVIQTILTRLCAPINQAEVNSDPSLPEDITQHAVRDLKNKIQPQLIEVADRQPLSADIAQKTLETCLAGETALPVSRIHRQAIYDQVLNEVLGLGPLEPLLKDPEVSEIMVNGPDSIFIEKAGKLHFTDVRFSSDAQLRATVDRIVAPLGRRVDESMPLCDARLPDGSRVHIVLPPLALDGPTLTIRKFMAKPMGLPQLIERHTLSGEMGDYLQRCVVSRKNMIVSGGTGSGKTTLLNALSSLIPDDERIVTVEDAAELRLQKPHVVRMESRPPNAEGQGAIAIRLLVMNALRMRPDRIVVGECRGGEALDMLQAMNTGHDGSLTTLHANSPRDALRRLETLVLLAGIDLPVRVIREQIQSAIQVIIQQARQTDGTRKIVSITEVTGLEGDVITLQEMYRYEANRFNATDLTSSVLRGPRA